MTKGSHPALSYLEHRPWPLPADPWGWQMSWGQLCFLHFPADPAVIQASLPRGLRVQIFNGQAWLAVVPFRMSGMVPRFGKRWASHPLCPTFPELNLRTYVEHEQEGKGGVYFYSLDAHWWPLVLGARLQFGLRYFPAAMQLREASEQRYHFTSQRLGPWSSPTAPMDFAATYGPVGETYFAQPGSFEH